MPVYSCPVIIYIVYVVVYMEEKPWTSLEQSRSLRHFLLPLDHLCLALLIEN